MPAKANKKNKGGTRVVTKTTTPKILPSANALVEFKSDANVGDYIRIILGNPGFKTEYVIHHPIGVTTLHKEDWVLSDPSEIAHLCSRKVDPNAERRKLDLEITIQEELIKHGNVKKDASGVLEYDDTSDGTRTDFLAILKTARKDAGNTWNRAQYLLQSSDKRAEKEERLDKIKAQTQKEFELKFPNTFQTMGGPRQDVPQKKLDWAEHLSRANLQDEIQKALLHGPPPDVNISEVTQPDLAEVLKQVARVTGFTNPRPTNLASLTSVSKNKILHHLKAIRGVLAKESPGSKIQILEETPPNPSG